MLKEMPTEQKQWNSERMHGDELLKIDGESFILSDYWKHRLKIHI